MPRAMQAGKQAGVANLGANDSQDNSARGTKATPKMTVILSQSTDLVEGEYFERPSVPQCRSAVSLHHRSRRKPVSPGNPALWEWGTVPHNSIHLYLKNAVFDIPRYIDTALHMAACPWPRALSVAGSFHLPRCFPRVIVEAVQW